MRTGVNDDGANGLHAKESVSSWASSAQFLFGPIPGNNLPQEFRTFQKELIIIVQVCRQAMCVP